MKTLGRQKTSIRLAAGLLTLGMLLAGCGTTGQPAVTTSPEATASSSASAAAASEQPSVTPEATPAASTAPAADATVYPLVVKDVNQKDITINAVPKVVISLAPSITETVFALGKGDVLKGRSDVCDYPPESASIPVVVTQMQLNVEQIVAAKPDVVLATGINDPKQLAKLEEVGIKVLNLNGGDSFDSVYANILTTAKVLDASAAAEKLIADMQAKVKSVTDKVASLSKPKVYFVVGYGEYGDFSATGDTFLGSMLEMAGAENVAKDGTQWSYTMEKIVKANPDLLICSKEYDSKKGIEASNGYKELTAVKAGKLFEVESALVQRTGPRLADGLLALAQIIHPEAFK